MALLKKRMTLFLLAAAVSIGSASAEAKTSQAVPCPEQNASAVPSLGELGKTYYALVLSEAKNQASACYRFGTPKEHVASPEKNSTVLRLTSLSQEMARVLPKSFGSEVLKTYLEALGIDLYWDNRDLGTKNYGLVRHFQKSLTQKSCLGQRVYQFFEEVDRLDKHSERDSRPNLLRAQAGDSESPNFKPGWTLELALKYTDGDMNAAFEILGACGHDDMAHELAIVDRSNEALKTRNQAIQVLEKELEHESGNPWTAQDLKQQLACLEKTPGLWKYVKCPKPYSPFYSAKSLSANADIPDSLKNRILQVHGNGRADFNPSAKYYHVYTGAYMGCLLASKGVSPGIAEKIEELTARTYRAVRLCATIDQPRSIAKPLSELWRNFVQMYKVHDQEVDPSIFNEDLANQILKKGDTCGRSRSTSLCAVRNELIELNPLPTIESERKPALLRRIKNLIASVDAATLHERWYWGGKTLGTELPCTDLRVFGPMGDLEEKRKDLAYGPSSLCGPGFTPERCQAALQKLAEWDLDAEWTMRQHAIGARFGASHCKKQEKLDDSKFCGPISF